MGPHSLCPSMPYHQLPLLPSPSLSTPEESAGWIWALRVHYMSWVIVYNVAEASLEFLTQLPLLSGCWAYRLMPP